MTEPRSDQVPRRRPGSSVHHRPGAAGGAGSAVIVDDEGRELVVLDDVAAALWQLCDGETDVEEITDAVCAVWDVDREVAERDVRHTLDVLRDAGVLAWNDES